MKLPPLPELPKRHFTREDVTGAVLWETEEGPYTADQLREFALAYGRAVQEECARVCERVILDWVDDSNKDTAEPLLCEAASAIRSTNRQPQ